MKIIKENIRQRRRLRSESLEEIYPTASAYAKEHEEYQGRSACRRRIFLQNGHPGYRAIWKHIMAVSVADLKKNYAKSECGI